MRLSIRAHGEKFPTPRQCLGSGLSMPPPWRGIAPNYWEFSWPSSDSGGNRKGTRNAGIRTLSQKPTESLGGQIVGLIAWGKATLPLPKARQQAKPLACIGDGSTIDLPTDLLRFFSSIPCRSEGSRGRLLDQPFILFRHSGVRSEPGSATAAADPRGPRKRRNPSFWGFC